MFAARHATSQRQRFAEPVYSGAIRKNTPLCNARATSTARRAAGGDVVAAETAAPGRRLRADWGRRTAGGRTRWPGIAHKCCRRIRRECRRRGPARNTDSRTPPPAKGRRAWRPGPRDQRQYRQHRVAHDRSPLSEIRATSSFPLIPAAYAMFRGQLHSHLRRYWRLRPPSSTSRSRLDIGAELSGVWISGSPPSSTRRLVMSGSFKIALISVLSLAMISFGVFFGAPMPNSALAS